jgi:hypothetical protein
MMRPSQIGNTPLHVRRTRDDCATAMREDRAPDSGTCTPVKLSSDRRVSNWDALPAFDAYDRVLDGRAITNIKVDVPERRRGLPDPQYIGRVEDGLRTSRDAIATAGAMTE